MNKVYRNKPESVEINCLCQCPFDFGKKAITSNRSGPKVKHKKSTPAGNKVFFYFGCLNKSQLFGRTLIRPDSVQIIRTSVLVFDRHGTIQKGNRSSMNFFHKL